jgi:hypothetical protein
MHALRFQFSQRFLDAIDAQAQACISCSRNFASHAGGNDLKQDTVDIEASNDISGNELEAQNIPIKLNGPLHVLRRKPLARRTRDLHRLNGASEGFRSSREWSRQLE